MKLREVLGYVPLIIGDGGHGENTYGKRTPEFPDGGVIKEYQFNKPTVTKFLQKAKGLGFDTLDVAPEEWDVSLQERVNRANEAYKQQKQKYPNAPKEKLVIYVSFHYNAQDAEWGGTNGGVEVYFYPGAKDAQTLSGNILEYLIQGRKQYNRGVKTSDFFVLRETIMTAVLIEAGFMDHEIEAQWMVEETFQEEVALETIKGCCKYFGISYDEQQVDQTPIIDSTDITSAQAQQWAQNNGATDTFVNLAPIYWELASKSGGVNPAVAYAQSAQETGFGRFGGVIDESFYNPCGMKTTKGGSSYDPEAHMRFDSWKTGILAHLDHLALYAGAKGYPRANSPDPRHFSYLKGRAITVEELGGNWTPSKDYGNNIVQRYLKGLEAIQIEPKDDKKVIQELREEIIKLEKQLKDIEEKYMNIEYRMEESESIKKRYKEILEKIKNLTQTI